MLVVVSIVSFLQLALLFKGAMLVHVLLKNLAAFDYQKYSAQRISKFNLYCTWKSKDLLGILCTSHSLVVKGS